jgi:hypothetical protein
MRDIKSIPAVMFPYWSLPPICIGVSHAPLQSYSKDSPNLQSAAFCPMQMPKVIRLQQLVCEFGIVDTLRRPHSSLDAFPCQHLADPDVFSDGAQEFDHPELIQPLAVRHQLPRSHLRLVVSAGNRVGSTALEELSDLRPETLELVPIYMSKHE